MWWMFLVVGGVGNILFHERANQVAVRLVRVLGVSLFLSSTRALAVVSTIVILLFMRRRFLISRRKIRDLAIVLSLGLVLDLSLIIYPSERIHYLEYGLLTWIAYKAIGKTLPAVLMAFLFGYVDEAHQYWVLYAHDPNVYFDWNDIILNLMAAIAALVLLLPEEEPERAMPKQHVVVASLVWIVAMALLVFRLNPDQYLFGNQSRSSFWITSGVETHYHVLNAMEGTIILGIILSSTVAYYWPREVRESEVSSSSRIEAAGESANVGTST
jgi:hypothetical protein